MHPAHTYGDKKLAKESIIKKMISQLGLNKDLYNSTSFVIGDAN